MAKIRLPKLRNSRTEDAAGNQYMKAVNRKVKFLKPMFEGVPDKLRPPHWGDFLGEVSNGNLVAVKRYEDISRAVAPKTKLPPISQVRQMEEHTRRAAKIHETAAEKKAKTDPQFREEWEHLKQEFGGEYIEEGQRALKNWLSPSKPKYDRSVN